MKSIKIAAAITNSQIGCIKQNLEKIEHFSKLASDNSVSIICFPEMNITGYSNSTKILDYAETIPGAVTDKIIKLAIKYNITILAGLAEKDINDRKVFISHIAAKPDESFEVYRKLHLGPPEKKIFTHGNSLPLFKSSGVCFGIQLCYDSHFPELSTYMAINGADIIFFPHASPNGSSKQKYHSWLRHLTARAYDNSIFVIATNQTGSNSINNFPGIAVVIEPSGNVLSNDITGDEGILIAQLDENLLKNIRNHQMKYFLPNRRSNLYRQLFQS